MAEVRFAGVTFSYPGFDTPALRELDLTVVHGEFLSVVGPSGSGKTTLLRLLSGVSTPTAGDILIGGRVITRVAPADRGVSTVPARPSLYAHMTVGQNIGFSMSISGVAASVVSARVVDIAGTLGLQRLLTRAPQSLSLPERQAVFLARALVRPSAVLVLDEPLAHLDRDDRQQARAQLARLRSSTDATILYVTQDFSEAMTLSDRIAVLDGGRLVELGPPLDVYHRPESLGAARFFGSPPMNTLDAVVTPDGARVGELLVPVRPGLDLAPGATVVLGIRAEAVHLLPRGAGLTVTGVEITGNTALVRGTLIGDPGGQSLVARCSMRDAPRIGDRITVDVLVDDHVQFFDPRNGRRL
ncbi:MAG: ABC transporter ATP-binding protein [Nakamurella sp.]